MQAAFGDVSEEKTMCPFCLATAVWIAVSVTSTGGLAAVAMRKIGGKNTVDNPPEPTATKERAHG